MPKLTKSFVESVDIEGWYRDSELKGFCLRVRRAKDGTVSRVYVINSRIRGANRSTTVTIGKHGIVTAEQARIQALAILATLSQGESPNLEVQQERQVVAETHNRIRSLEQLQSRTLKHLLDDYLSTHALKPATAIAYSKLICRCLKDWLNLPLTKITRDMVQQRQIAMSAEHPSQANYTMRVLRALFKYAIAVYEDDAGTALLTINPVDRLKHARLWNRSVRRQRVIRPHQLKAWHDAVVKLERTDVRDILLLEIFTGLRHCEAVSLQWEDVDFAHETITVNDTKNHLAHMIPMTTYLRTMLEARHRETGDNRFVFPGSGRTGHITDFRNSINQVVRISGVQFSEHDLRRTFETTAESLDISYYTLKKLLNHKTGSDPTAGYIITSVERMREAAQKVANHLAKHMGILSTQTDKRRFNMYRSASG